MNVMEGYYVLVFIFGILTSVLLVGVFFVNRLFSKKERIDFLFDNVMKYVEERIVLFERMVNFVEENAEKEVKLIKDLYDFNNNLSEMLKNKDYDLKEVKKSERMFDKFASLGKTYNDFNKNEIYKMLVDESKINVDRILYAVESYNEKVLDYNEFKKTRVNSFIAKIFRLKDYEYYDK